MAITRREFLKYSAISGAALFLGVFDLKPIEAYAQANPPEWITETYNICPFCGVGCGIIIGKNIQGQITYVQGDPENPNNLGSLCSKGQNAGQLNHIAGYTRPSGIPDTDKNGVKYKADDSERVIRPLVRYSGDTNWTATGWNSIMTEIVNKIATTRTIDGDGKCTNIAVLGSAKCTNEECYLLTKLVRALGIVYYEHCARL